MSAYSELIKNFEKMRGFVREFYVYGFKSRDEYNKKSARSYDDERRRLEAWLGDYMGFIRNPEGKSVFISVDSQSVCHNPFYKALKSKSFTSNDITLHFILFDILFSPDISLSLPEILEKIDSYLSNFENPMTLEESTVRKKLNEYAKQGLIETQKVGKKMMYKRAKSVELCSHADLLSFYSEVFPCGCIGSFLLDKQNDGSENFCFKHHYITSAMDSSVLAELFVAMREKSIITASNYSRGKSPQKIKVIPLKIFISVQNGRQYLLAYGPEFNTIKSFRIDYLSDVKIEEPTDRFDELRAELNLMQDKMWGVISKKENFFGRETEHIEFTVKVNRDEQYIVNRLYREKRCGYIEKIDDFTYRYIADVFDINEMFPWIRTFICRITSLHFSNPHLEKQFKDDIRKMYEIYGLEEAM